MSAPDPPSQSERYRPRFVDIGINLTDPVYTGKYYGTQRHDNDLSSVLARAREAGCEKLIVTGSDVKESQKAIELCKKYPNFLFCTVGVHPCSSQSFIKHPQGAAALLSQLQALATSPSPTPVVAFGEIGLDYDRLELCPKDVQLEFFEAQLDVAVSVSLPLFLHSRAAAGDFTRLLRARLDRLPKRGVVHSFTGTVEEMMEVVEMGFDIGINGCSLKTEENVAVVRKVPLERLQLETDGPWCEMRASHASAGYLKGQGDADGREVLGREEAWKWAKKEKWIEGALVKGRNEPCMIGRVAVAVAAIKGLSVKEVSDRAWENSVRMFGLGDL